MSASDLASFFAPRGVVVVGASSSADKLGFAMASSLASFSGSVQLVNTRPTPGMYSSISEAVSDAGTAVDLAVMCVPAAVTASALRESAGLGVRAALVCAGGFAEAGGPGIQYAQAVDAAVDETGIRLIGPNTSGFFVPGDSLFASFVPGVREFRGGSVAVVAASGGVNHVLSFQLEAHGAGVSFGVGIGAAQDVSAPEVLRYLIDHEQSRAVILHVETVPDGRELIAAIEELSAVKPVIALVVGRNDVSEFAQSHTGALATSWRTTRAALRQAGAVLVDDEEHAVDAATALAGRRSRPSASAAVGLVTGQAGPGLIIADSLASSGVSVPRFAPETIAALADLLPPITFQANPVDTGRPGETFPAVLRAVVDDPAIDILALYALTEPVVDLSASVLTADIDPTVPILLAVDGPESDYADARRSATAAGLPLLRGPSRLARGIAAVVEDARNQSSRALEQAQLSAGAAGGTVADADHSGSWDEIRGKELLDELGIATPPRRRCANRAEAHDALTALGGPVAVKLVDAEVLHKSDIGGVFLGIDSESGLDGALDALERAGASTFLVEKMAPSGIDLIVGARVDPVFGPIVVLGMGGVTAEILGDIAIRTAPVGAATAARMIDDLAGRALLAGYRGGPTVDESALGKVISSIASLVASGKIVEIEINPLRVTADGIVALDAVVIPGE